MNNLRPPFPGPVAQPQPQQGHHHPPNGIINNNNPNRPPPVASQPRRATKPTDPRRGSPLPPAGRCQTRIPLAA